MLGLICIVVFGLFSVLALGSYSYFITIIEELSRYGYVYLMKYKFKALEKFKEFKTEVENQKGKSIKILQLGRGGEYLSTGFNDYLKPVA